MKKSKNLSKPIEFQNWANFLEEFQNETDRSSAILGAAFLDELLAKLIARFILEDDQTANDLLRGAFAPGGTFSSRILIVFSLGLISSDERHDLQLINRIRNKFAHELSGISFEQDSIKAQCNQFILPKLGEEAGIYSNTKDPRQLFINCVLMMATFMDRRKMSISDHCVQPPRFVIKQIDI